MFLFPIYFAMVPGLVGLDDVSSSETSGNWSVSFTEQTLTQTENSGELGDGETWDSIFVITEDMIDVGANVASVTIEVSCNDDDDVGFNDGFGIGGGCVPGCFFGGSLGFVRARVHVGGDSDGDSGCELMLFSRWNARFGWDVGLTRNILGTYL